MSSIKPENVVSIFGLGLHDETPEDEHSIQLQPKSIDDLLNDAFIDVREDIPEPPTCLSMISGFKEYPIAELGNFTLVIGKAKSKKSFFMAIIAASMAKNGIVLNYKSTLPTNQRNVLYFDTEQSRYHVQKAMKRVCRLMEIEQPTTLFPYGLRKYCPQERFKMIEHKIYNTPNLGFVVIDGIRDLVSSINDEEEATKVTSALLKWSEELNIHIFTVLHQNKGDSNARGHLGSECVNKAQTTLAVVKDQQDKDVSIVNALFCRGKEPDLFAFRIDEDGMPICESDFKGFEDDKSKKVSHLDIGDDNLYEILKLAFSVDKELSYEPLWRNIKVRYYEFVSNELSDNKAKDLVSMAKSKGWVKQEANKKPYTLGSFKTLTDEAA